MRNFIKRADVDVSQRLIFEANLFLFITLMPWCTSTSSFFTFFLFSFFQINQPDDFELTIDQLNKEFELSNVFPEEYVKVDPHLVAELNQQNFR